MSATGKIGIAIAVIVVLGLLWWGYSSNQEVVPTGTGTGSEQTYPAGSNGGNEPQSSTGGSSGALSTNAQLEASLQSMDGEFTALDNDATQADGGLNDKPVSQAE